MGITYKQLKAIEKTLEEKDFFIQYPDNPLDGEDYSWVKIFNTGLLILKVFNRQREWREFEDLRKRTDFYITACEVYAQNGIGGTFSLKCHCRDSLDIEKIEKEAVAFLQFARTNLSSL